MILQMRKPGLRLLLTLFLFAVASPASATSFLVYTGSTDGPGTLWDSTDLSGLSNPRPTIGGLIDISFGPGGSLFGLGGDTNNPLLYSINPVTGASTPIGTGTGLGFVFEGDLAYDPTSGILYGFAELFTISADCCVNLFTINTTTGVATVVGGVDFDQSFVSMMSFDSAGNLWLINQLPGGTTLVSLDKTTGAVLSEVALFGDSTNLSDPTGGMVFDPATNTMYLANTVRWTINTSTGEITALFGGLSFAPDVRGLAVVPDGVVAPVPEPATLLLFGTGLAAAGVRRYRRKQ